MFQRIVTACRRFARIPQTSAVRRSACLNIAPLEERAIPSITPTFAAPIMPPEMVMVAPIAPAQSAGWAGGNFAVPSSIVRSLVRTDLIVPGETAPGDRNQAWEDAMIGKVAPQDEAVFALKPRRQEANAPAPPVDESAEEAMLEEAAALAQELPLAA